MSLLLTTWIAAPLALAQPGEREQPSFRERYGQLVDRNIFVKDRRPASRPSEPREAPPPPPLEAGFIVTGIVKEGDAWRAHIENRPRGEFLRVAVGEAVARGRVAEIDLDSIVYEVDGQRTHVQIGQDLRGQAAAVIARPAPPPETAPAGVAPVAGAPTADGTTAPLPAAGAAPAAAEDLSALSVEERMRRRRAQETRQP